METAFGAPRNAPHLPKNQDSRAFSAHQPQTMVTNHITRLAAAFK
jgi:hypothetical protein